MVVNMMPVVVQTTMPDQNSNSGQSVLDDKQLLKKAKNAENGRRFTYLFEEGWSSSVVRRVYDRRRCAELALITHLVWWASHDTGQVQRLFQQSAMYRDEIRRKPRYLHDLVRSARELLGSECYRSDYSVAAKR